MKKILLISAVFFLGCATLSAQVVNTCEADKVCKPTTICDTKVIKFVSWTAYQDWVNAHQGWNGERVYASSTYPIIEWDENCWIEQRCYDNEGECE